MQKVNYSTIDEYIRLFPKNVQATLEKFRRTIKRAAPGAEEAIRYGIPTFIWHGNVVHFAAFKNHFGFFPGSTGVAAFKKELSPYETSKGTIRFPSDKPLPLSLITRIVKYRVKENEDRAIKKTKKA